MPKRKTTPASPAVDTKAKFENQPIFGAIINELDVNRDQNAKRQQNIKDIEAALTAKFKKPNRLIVYMMQFGHSKSMIQGADINALDAILSSVSGAQQLNVLIHSPGGDGSIIEKMIEMCRGHLSYRDCSLRVIVPNIAKSAATVFALGADSIMMSYSSELGPIDPQVQIVVSGVVKSVSANSFVETRDLLMEQLAEAIKNKEPPQGILAQIAGLNAVFTKEMENVIDFSKKTASRLLEKYMLKNKIKNDVARKKKADEIAQMLLSKQLFPIHGHFINATTAKKDLGLEIDIVARDDALWRLIWEYYIRAEVHLQLQTPGHGVRIKLFESASVSLNTMAPPDQAPAPRQQPQIEQGT